MTKFASLALALFILACNQEANQSIACGEGTILNEEGTMCVVVWVVETQPDITSEPDPSNGDTAETEGSDVHNAVDPEVSPSSDVGTVPEPVTDLDCDDGDPCTWDYNDNGQCQHPKIQGCALCMVDADCTSTYDLENFTSFTSICVAGVCRYLSNGMVQSGVGVTCSSNHIVTVRGEGSPLWVTDWNGWGFYIMEWAETMYARFYKEVPTDCWCVGTDGILYRGSLTVDGTAWRMTCHADPELEGK